jgi:Domain of Unknown Function with PDB structure (DUF3857)/Transglutaminase-like superfamily
LIGSRSSLLGAPLSLPLASRNRLFTVGGRVTYPSSPKFAKFGPRCAIPRRGWMNQSFIARLVVLLAAAALGGLETGAACAQGQGDKPVDAPHAAIQPPFSIQYEGHITVRADRTSTELSTKRIKILTSGAVQSLSQQQLQFVEGMETLQTVEAYTQKADGRRVPVGADNIMTRDGASNLQATYVPDLKVRTIIFPDVAVGDTLVMTNKSDIIHGIFPGQFADSDVFPRSQSLTSVDVTVEAPESIGLIVKATGAGSTDRIETSNGLVHHTIKIATEPYEPEEPGAVSPFDREPILMISTFRSYAELGMAYGQAAFPKTRPTPEIVALANQITAGIDDPKAQAVAIDAWVKKNIRYVALFLSVGRVVPHEAAAVLVNKFGDCKDKATLMIALLAAKGIGAEAALINLGNVYTLADPPTLAALNHVILYLPQFDLYDDPTANAAAFGVLAPEAYDKPVVRVSATAAKLARTPAMRPQDHVSHAVTTVNFAADGAITGTTEETNIGFTGMSLRFASGIVQQLGEETAASRQLQSFSTPGTGHFQLGDFAEPRDPARVKSDFALNDRFKLTAAGGIASIPFGLPITLRPGTLMFGQRLVGRKFPFGCYAGTQIEDIDATFDKSLPMPAPIPPLNIDNPWFTYRATFKIEDRTLKAHREFASRAPGQVCPPETEAQIAADLEKVRINVNGVYRFNAIFAAAPKPPPQAELTRLAVPGQKRRLDSFYTANADCSSRGITAVTMVDPPKHGHANVDLQAVAPNYPAGSPLSACNNRQVDGTILDYEAAADFTGVDSITVDVTFPFSPPLRRHYAINVDPAGAAAAPTAPQAPELVKQVSAAAPSVPLAPAAAALAQPSSNPAAPAPILELSRVAVAGQQLRVAFLYDLNPDCSLIGIPTVRIVEEPKSGLVKVDKDAGFPGFPANNPRFKCNSARTDGAVIYYTPNTGFTGADSITVDIIFPDGNAAKRRYAIDVR